MENPPVQVTLLSKGTCNPSTCTVLYLHFLWQKMGEGEGKHNIADVCQASFSFFSHDSKQQVLFTMTDLPAESCKAPQ